MIKNLKLTKNYDSERYPINVVLMLFSHKGTDGERILASYEGVESFESQATVLSGKVPAGGKDRHIIEGGLTGGTGTISISELTEDFEVDLLGKKIVDGLVEAGTDAVSPEVAISQVIVFNDGSYKFIGYPSTKLSKPQQTQTGTNVDDVAAAYISVPFTYKPDAQGVSEVSKDDIAKEDIAKFVKRVHGVDLPIEDE